MLRLSVFSVRSSLASSHFVLQKNSLPDVVLSISHVDGIRGNRIDAPYPHNRIADFSSLDLLCATQLKHSVIIRRLIESPQPALVDKLRLRRRLDGKLDRVREQLRRFALRLHVYVDVSREGVVGWRHLGR